MNFRTKLRLAWISLRLEFHEARLHRWHDIAHSFAMVREQYEEGLENPTGTEERIGVLNAVAATMAKREHDTILPHVHRGLSKHYRKIEELETQRRQLVS